MGIDAMKVYGGGDLLNAENSPFGKAHDAGAVYRIRPDAAGRGFRDGRMQNAGRNPGRTRLVRRIARPKGTMPPQWPAWSGLPGKGIACTAAIAPPVRRE